MRPDEPAPSAGAARSASAASTAGEILIAGGGIGGLAAALALARSGVPVHVLEERAAFPEEGAGIQIGPNGVRILRALGVADKLAPLAGVPDSIRVGDGRSGRPLAELPLGDVIAERHGAPYWVAHRSDLHAALLAGVRGAPLARLTTDATVTGAAVVPGAVEAITRSGTVHRGHGLVAADGVWSRLRTALFDPTPPRFQFRSAARTVLPRTAATGSLALNATYAWLTPGAHVVHYPVRCGREIAVVVVVSEERASRDWSAEVLPAWVAERTRLFHPALRGMLAAAPQWRKWSLHALPVPASIAKGPVALLGDAAHPVLPFLAQGGVMALEDAAVLAREIAASPAEVPLAFARYQTARLQRVARVASASYRNGQIYHLGGPMAAARNATMQLMGGRRLIESYDWLYGWRVYSG
jgi:salicylate hydroxylase